MGWSELQEMIHDAKRAGEESISAEECRIETTATSLDDELFVTLPNSEAPTVAEHVAYWRLAVGLDGEGNLVPRWPTRGEKGLAIYMDTDEIWLIY